jgi:hypothetical protein
MAELITMDQQSYEDDYLNGYATMGELLLGSDLPP